MERERYPEKEREEGEGEQKNRTEERSNMAHPRTPTIRAGSLGLSSLASEPRYFMEAEFAIVAPDLQFRRRARFQTRDFECHAGSGRDRLREIPNANNDCVV